MAATQSILQNVRQQTVVKVISDGSPGQSNVNLLDSKRPDETFLGYALCNVNIQTVIYSSSDSSSSPIVISRGVTAYNASNVMYLHGSGSMNFAQETGFNDKTLNASNITINMPALSVLYLILGKPSGYLEPDFQGNIFVQRMN
jgi:hypothetical protein